LHLKPLNRFEPSAFSTVTRHIGQQKGNSHEKCRNPTVKVVLYGAMASLGGALMAELLRRQHEVIAILDDLNVLAPRPGCAKAAICSMPSGSSKA
jgi:hypothetical protein